MRFLNVGWAKPHQPSVTLLLFFLIVLLAQLASAQAKTNTDVGATTGHTTQSTTATDPTTTNTGKTTDSTSTTGATTTDASTTDTSTSSSSSTTGASTTTDSSTTSTVSATNLAGTATSTTSTDGYPVVTVPPTADAPYMQKSNTPEGTVFIAVGAALGLIGLSVLAWRGLVAWSVNRSVRRAALMHASEKKGILRSKRKRSSRHSRAPPASMSLEKLPAHHRNSYNPRASNIPTGSGLFFSPTAGAGLNTTGSRGSSYLPAGYYAAGNAAVASTQNIPYSTPEMRPHSQGYVRTKSDPSPPRSPGLSPSGLHDTHYDPHARHSYLAGSTSSLNLASPTHPAHGRTPSAFLEDLFESHAPQSDNGHR